MNPHSTDGEVPGERSPDGFGPAEFHAKKKRTAPALGLMLPIRGFGPAGDFTLWLPSAKTESRITLEGGKAVRRAGGSCLNNPQIRELRDRVLRSATSIDGGALLNVDIAFVEYAAAVIGLAYDATDADLSFLLAGSGWHDAMFRHLMGGDDVVRQLASMASTPPAPATPIADVTPPRPAPALPRRAGLRQRLAGWIWK